MEHVAKAFRFPFEFYEWMMSKSDPRTLDWPLCGTPFPILSIILCYVYFVKVAGPQWMKNRPPFKIEGIIVLYNVLMVILSAGFFLYAGVNTYFPPWGTYNWICEPIDYRKTPETMHLVAIGWWYFLLKVSEFADTIFFVLRKKFTHISALHVIHHTLVAWGVWIGLKFGGGGSNAFFPLLNCFVHTIMYSYYCLAALGPSMRKYLWWKKYLTIIQMTHFVIAFAHAMVPLFYDCGFHKGFAYALMFHALLFMVMFMNFYRHAYKQKRVATSDSEVTLMSNGATTAAISNDKHDKNGSIRQNNGAAIREEAARRKMSSKDL